MFMYRIYHVTSRVKGGHEGVDCFTLCSLGAKHDRSRDLSICDNRGLQCSCTVIEMNVYCNTNQDFMEFVTQHQHI